LQADHLSKAKELLVFKLPHKMDEYYPLLLEFQTTSDIVEKQRILEIVMDCVDAIPQLRYLTAATGCVRQMLNDAFPSVVKAALLAAKRLIVLSLHALCCAEKREEDSARSQWQALNGFIENVTDPTLTNHKNQGVRMLAFKLIEQITLMTSASHCPGLKGVPGQYYCFTRRLRSLCTTL
jgi:hypothetical protein